MPNAHSHSRRHLLIPDCQVRPGVPLDHIDWIAQAIVDYKPDVVVEMGDFWDFPSLNSHSADGELEGARYKEDLVVGNRAFARMCKPMEKEQEAQRRRRNPWSPVKVKLMGNHEVRADRVAESDPRWKGTVTSEDCDTRDWTVYPFLERVWLDGVCYSHYFQASHSDHPVGGSVENRLNKICASFACGHEQGFRYGNRMTASGATLHGIVAGSCYTHIEKYRGRQGQRHWRGIVVLNEVRGGDFCIMPLTLDYLCRKYEGVSLFKYMKANYPRQNWDHLA